MSGDYQKLIWKEGMNGIAIDCSLDIAVHSSNSNIVLLIIPGVDGSVDGYENKYVRIADDIQNKHSVAVVRMSNPFISAFFWESTVRQVLEYIQDNQTQIANRGNIELRIMAHSAGASIIAQIAWEYPFISRLLLVNPAIKLNPGKILHGLSEFGKNKVTILAGSNDLSVDDIKEISDAQVVIIEGADHNFSGDSFPIFLQAPSKYLL